MLAFIEFVGHKVVVIRSDGGMCLDMGCLKKNDRMEIVMGRF